MRGTVVTVSDETTAAVIDFRHFPVVVTTFWGASTEKLMREYFSAMNRFHATLQPGERYVGVADGSESKRPDAVARKVIAELTDANQEEIKSWCIESYTVVTSGLVRGAVTAIQWLTQKKWDLELVPSMDEAFDKARATLEGAGLPWPESLDPASYVRPTSPIAEAG